jgi:hypothetical protein
MTGGTRKPLQTESDYLIFETKPLELYVARKPGEKRAKRVPNRFFMRRMRLG